MVDNYSFLSNTFRDLSDGASPAVAAFRESPEERQRSGKGWPVYIPADGNVKALLDSGDANTYFCISSVKRQRPLSRARAHFRALHVVPLDDVGWGEGSKYTPDTVPLQPTYILETSKDNYQYGYVLETPVDDERKATALIKAVAQEHGDSGGSMAMKLIRLPVGYNNKEAYDETWDVKLFAYERTARFTLDELGEAFGFVPDELGQGDDQRKQEYLPNQFFSDDFFDWMISEGWVIEHPNAEGFATIVCPWAAKHSDGDVKAYFSPVGAGGDDFADSWQFNCYHECCRERAWHDLALLMMQRRYVVESGRKVYDAKLPAKLPLTMEGLRNIMRPYYWTYKDFNGKSKTVHAFNRWLDSRGKLTVDREGFHPQQPTIYRDAHTDERVFNTFTAMPEFEYTEDTDKLEPILEQLNYLFGSETENAMTFLAYTVHRPALRIPFALLHISIFHGTGRGWLKRLTEKLVGEKYVAVPTLSDFVAGQYNEYVYQTLIMFFDEVRQKSIRYNAQDKLRELITENRMNVNQKWGFKGITDVFANTVFFSNHLDALQIPDNDRRLWVVLNDAAPRPDKTYAQLYSLLEDEETLAQFYWYLLTWMADHELPQRAPRTKWREDSQEQSRSELESELREAVSALKRADVKAVYLHHFYEVCKAMDVRLPPGLTSADGQKEKAQFWAIMGELNVTRGKRTKPSKEAAKAMPGMGAKTNVLRLDMKAGRDECEDAARDQFLLSRLEREDEPRAGISAPIAGAKGVSQLMGD